MEARSAVGKASHLQHSCTIAAATEMVSFSTQLRTIVQGMKTSGLHSAKTQFDPQTT